MQWVFLVLALCVLACRALDDRSIAFRASWYLCASYVVGDMVSWDAMYMCNVTHEGYPCAYWWPESVAEYEMLNQALAPPQRPDRWRRFA